MKLKTEEDRCKELKRNLDERDARASVIMGTMVLWEGFHRELTSHFLAMKDAVSGFGGTLVSDKAM